MVSLIRVDLPEPETPVIAVNSPEEIVRSTSLRLLPDAPSSLSCIFRLGLWRCFGTSICRLPLRYWPVSERGASSTLRSEEHTSELQSLMRISYAVFCLNKK